MKKSLLALAVLGAFAGVASAQTNVTIYGVADAAIQYTSNAAGKTWGLNSGQQSGSRLGFKGTEDLGGGLSAIFTLENGFNIDNGSVAQSTATTTRLFGRQAWVGLQGGFGSVKLGRQQTPVYGASIAVDPFNGSLMGSAQRFWGYGAYNTDPFLRSDNTLSYSTANYGGFTGTVAYAFGEAADNFAANRSQEAGASYVNGPINAQFAYQKSNATAGAASADVRTYLLGGSYDFGVVKPFLAFGDTRFDAGVAGVTGSAKVRNWLLGVTAPVGPAGTVMASWNRSDVRDLSNGASNQYAIGYSHSLSKRTNLYTAFAYNKNDSNVNLLANKNGDSQRQLSVGVRHTF